MIRLLFAAGILLSFKSLRFAFASVNCFSVVAIPFSAVVMASVKSSLATLIPVSMPCSNSGNA